jgi:hypothetical protein
MKIIIPNLPIYILKYIAQCVQSVNDDSLAVIMWDINRISILDMFDETRPDILFLHTSHIDNTFAMACKEFDFKYVLIVTEDQIPKTDNLPQTPIAILDLSHMGITNPVGENIIRPAHMANIPDIHNAKYIDKLKSTILIDTTSVVFDDSIIELLNYIANQYPTKIIGEQHVSLHNYLGRVGMVDRANFFKSAKVVVDIGNSGDYWDAAYLKIPSLSISPTHSVILYCADLAAFQHNLDSILNKELIRKKYIDESYKASCYNTSFLFSARLFNSIGEPKLSSDLLKTQEALI